MKRLFIVGIVSLLFSFSLFAQTTYDEDYYSEDYDDSFVYETSDYGMTSVGDQHLKIGLQADFGVAPRNLGWGGTADLNYTNFLSDVLSIGGGVNFLYMRTKGSNIFYCVPFMGTASIQTTFGRWEIPLSISAGFALQSYLNKFYLGPVIKPEIGTFYRYSSDWSIGVTVGATVMPQFYFTKVSENRIGTVINAGLSVRYHF